MNSSKKHALSNSRETHHQHHHHHHDTKQQQLLSFSATVQPTRVTVPVAVNACTCRQQAPTQHLTWWSLSFLPTVVILYRCRWAPGGAAAENNKRRPRLDDPQIVAQNMPACKRPLPNLGLPRANERQAAGEHTKTGEWRAGEREIERKSTW